MIRKMTNCTMTNDLDNFVDLDEAKKILRGILERHFAIFGGYSNNRLLFRAATQELPMFLNDNDCATVDKVYAIAKFLFEEKTSGKSYKFYEPHIFEREPKYSPNLKGLMIHLAEQNGGILNRSDAKEYLRKIMFGYSNLKQILQIHSSKTFLMYDTENYLLSASIGINAAWCRQIHEKLDDLFRTADVAYIIPQDINQFWLDTLPVLSQNLKWTTILLQDVLNKYPAVGYRALPNEVIRSRQSLAAAFVPISSTLMSFADVVTLRIKENYRLPIRMSVENLRKELRAAGILMNNEPVNALSKVLDDYRFAWSNDNQSVYVQSNF